MAALSNSIDMLAVKKGWAQFALELGAARMAAGEYDTVARYE